MAAKLGRQSSNFGQCWPVWAHALPNLSQFGETWPDFDHVLAKLCQTLAGFYQSCPKSGLSGQVSLQTYTRNLFWKFILAYACAGPCGEVSSQTFWHVCALRLKLVHSLSAGLLRFFLRARRFTNGLPRSLCQEFSGYSCRNMKNTQNAQVSTYWSSGAAVSSGAAQYSSKAKPSAPIGAAPPPHPADRGARQRHGRRSGRRWPAKGLGKAEARFRAHMWKRGRWLPNLRGKSRPRAVHTTCCVCVAILAQGSSGGRELRSLR